MAKKAKTTEGQTGVQWLTAEPQSVSAAVKKQYETYFNAFETAGEEGATLKEMAQKEWDKAYPEGITEGGVTKFCRYNAIGGVLLYVFVEEKKAKVKEKKKFSDIQGTNPFAHARPLGRAS